LRHLIFSTPGQCFVFSQFPTIIGPGQWLNPR
jgi:hypothetical protein